jgi:hypothetical protein
MGTKKYSSYAQIRELEILKIEKEISYQKLFWVSIGQKKANAESFIEQLLGIL